MQGEPFKGEVSSADASAGVAFTLYKNGSLDAYTLAPGEYLEIHSVQLVTAPGGDVFIFTGADGTAGAGEYVVRGTFAATGGLVQEVRPPHVGKVNHLAYVDAPAGQVDAIIRGTIRREGDGTAVRPGWKEALKGG
jgi:hypothetical protein